MRILSFDSSTATLQAALLERRNCVLAESLTPDTSNRSDAAAQLLPLLDRLIEEAKWRKTDVELIVVGIGPGSFTGIRVAVITARTLAQALGLPLIGVGKLEALAAAAAHPVGVALKAGRGGWFVAGYGDLEGATAAPLVEPQFVTGQTLSELLHLLPRWVTDAGGQDEPALASLAAAGRLEPLPSGESVAVAQARLAWDRLSWKEAPGAPAGRRRLASEFPWTAVVPLYLRDPSVTIKQTHGNPNS